MSIVTFELQLLGLVGIFIHYLKDWVNYNNEGKAYQWQKSLPTILLSVTTTAVLIYLRGDIENIYPITPFSAVALGYIGNSAFFSFVKPKEKQAKQLDNGN